jgi:hypothetical protein
MHAFFLNWILVQAEATDAKDSQEQRQADAGGRWCQLQETRLWMLTAGVRCSAGK